MIDSSDDLPTPGPNEPVPTWPEYEQLRDAVEAFAVECALDAAWATEFWRPTDPDYGFVDYFEAAAARNIGLLHGFEELGDSATRRGILPGVESEQVQLVTGGGGDWHPEPANLRDSEQAGLQAFSIGGGENGN